ncbi:gliding motility-associated C-terminal domain-containing protein [uncultured Roseivirga sp.]|uniref:gliding motility-associated C-terminal domain-containing protein n=1 Tax=uncultured Roseivirga sp. TaxID=543088 RepID=UPI000D791E65|nr:gliding motility-associated C-terminal domain-containing protein [uncultured Roseivirga sp.]PWL28514.1 MAG: hypothetical protein DCO95_14210 [Roseivirga sp. XM-24bin3]
MNRSLLLSIVLLFVSQLKLNGQVFINGSKARIVNQGNPSIRVNNLDFINDGEFILKKGDFIVHSSKRETYLEGKNTPEFANFRLDINGILFISSDITVKKNFYIERGEVDLLNSDLILPLNESKLEGETVDHRILSSGKGEIVKHFVKEKINNQNVGNLGLVFSEFENTDSLTIRRGHSALPIPFGESITRYYKVSTHKKSQDKIDLELEYFEDEVVNVDPNMVEQVWVMNAGEWDRAQANTTQNNKLNGRTVKANLEIYESTITVGLYRRLIDWNTVPNTFTPNNDGINDTFVIPGIEKLPNAEVRIYNVYGKLLYQTTDYQRKPWDGTNEGKLQPIGAYLYQVIDSTNPLEFVEGEVSIIK